MSAYKFRNGRTASDWRLFIENCCTGDNYFRGSEYRQLIADLEGAAADIEQLAREREADRKDAERMRWLRDHVLPAWSRPDGADSYPYAELQIYLCRNADGSVERFGLIGRKTKIGIISIDEAIDNARAADLPQQATEPPK